MVVADTVSSIRDPWGERAPYGVGTERPPRVDVQLAEGLAVVSMPELGRIRFILGKASLFLVVQDFFQTETAQYLRPHEPPSVDFPFALTTGRTIYQFHTRTKTVRAAARISDIRPGVLFPPFHYGYWDTDGRAEGRAANELMLTDWDPASEQPIFKTAVAALDSDCGIRQEE